ncbi:MFS transporter [Clostridium sp. C2-6-12]|uniref:MFS transporter n=1 Tax=Clostridium sp. C2-6-12 TaxID=2698832 RepID=UPI00136B19E7|nr:MFS transporter [Clostridium sp. C2-6-12]
MEKEIVLNSQSSYYKSSYGKLSFLTKFSYGLGEFACSVVWSLVSSYLLYFYTDVFGLAGGVIAVLLLVARVWDCFVDPILGLIIERTRSRFGRFRPYILFGSLSLGLFNILTFYTPQFSATGKAIYACVTYLLLGSFHSIVNVPYGALATVMPLITILGNGNNQNGYFYASIVLTLIAIPMLFLTFKNCKEVIEPTKEESPKIKDSFKAIINNKPLALILLTLTFTLFAIFSRLGLIVYWAINVLGRPDLIPVLFTTLSIAGAIGGIILPTIAKPVEKRIILMGGSMLSGLSLIGIYFIPPTSVTGIIILTFTGCLPIGAGAIQYGMMADTIDDYQVKVGVRTDASVYAFSSFISKVVNAIVGSLSVMLLGFIGYVANAQQTPEVIRGINILVNLVPGIWYLFAAVPMLFYTITKAKANENTKILIERQSQNTNN